MKKILLILLFSNVVLAQKPLLKVEIDQIKTDHSNPNKTGYTIFYHIQNQSDTDVLMFLNPKTFIANAAASMTLFPYYKIYQNRLYQNLDGPFFENTNYETFQNNLSEEQNLEAYYQKKAMNDIETIEKYKKNGGSSTDEVWILQNQEILASKMILKKQETLHFQIQTIWNKQRYYKQDNIEYYLDDKDYFDIELTLDLKKTVFKDRLTALEYQEIQANPNFIEGVFVSNKSKIEFID